MMKDWHPFLWDVPRLSGEHWQNVQGFWERDGMRILHQWQAVHLPGKAERECSVD